MLRSLKKNEMVSLSVLFTVIGKTNKYQPQNHHNEWLFQKNIVFKNFSKKNSFLHYDKQTHLFAYSTLKS